MDWIMILIIAVGVLVMISFVLVESHVTNQREKLGVGEDLAPDNMVPGNKSFKVVQVLLFLALILLSVMAWQMGYFDSFFALLGLGT